MTTYYVRRLFGGILLMAGSAWGQTFDPSTWQTLATQTCVQQAPKNSAVQALNLNATQLQYNCGCVAHDLLTVLPLSERQKLLRAMQVRRNLQQVGEQMMAQYEVKKTVLACSAAAWWR